MRKRAMGLELTVRKREFTIRKSNGVRVHYK